MTYQANHLEDIMLSVNNLMQVIQNIFNTYLIETVKEPLYDENELNQLLTQLSLMSRVELRAQFENAIGRYASPLPLRPHFSELYKMRIHYMLTLKRYTDIDPSHLTLESEKLFIETLLDALEKNSMSLSKITRDNLDNFFEKLRFNFQSSFLQRIQAPLKKAMTSDIPSFFPTAHEEKCSNPINNSRSSRPVVTTFDGYDSETGDALLDIFIEEELIADLNGLKL